MFLKQLKLTNFRNYSNLSLEFDDRPTILLGNNAVGKSNMLESIYFLSTTKSQRVETEGELIKEGESVCRVEGLISLNRHSELVSESQILNQVQDDSVGLEIGMQITEGQFSKRVKVNGVPRRVVDFVGHLPAVIFYPSDINMVTGPPSLRRWHLDLGLAQVDHEYKKFLTLYEQVLTARNKVLKRIKEGEGGLDELVYWTDELLKHGKGISEKRGKFFEFINGLENSLGKFEFKYQPSKLSQERLDQYSSREIAAAATLIGPHRDDFRVILGSEERATPESDKGVDSGQARMTMGDKRGRDLAHFGSRGEQRTATLAFKLAQLEYMAKILGQRPVLLLDDVFSELDAEHRAHVIEIVSKQQTIIATVELEHIPKKFLNKARILGVENGIIKEIS